MNVERKLLTDASPLIELSHLANRNGVFEWLAMINHSGQIGGLLLEPAPILQTKIRFKSVKPIKKLRLMRAATAHGFKQQDGWVECVVPRLNDFEMLLFLYE